ncbi:MAG: hypothetical protein BWY17_05232 [Deltaproteobacteria bacterium ADurb.Bin207]|nr:MAG: hypothetical protein BWY17_05232 [Deltaproteobacteria bacterium ADurb.Bin207]
MSLDTVIRAAIYLKGKRFNPLIPMLQRHVIRRRLASRRPGFFNLQLLDDRWRAIEQSIEPKAQPIHRGRQSQRQKQRTSSKHTQRIRATPKGKCQQGNRRQPPHDPKTNAYLERAPK